MRRAIYYAKGDFINTLNEIQKEVYTSLQMRLDDAKAHEKKISQSIVEQYTVHLDNAEKEVARLHQEKKEEILKLQREEKEQIEKKRETDYLVACEYMNRARTEDDFNEMAECFEQFGNYRDCKTRMEQCREKAIQCHREKEYKATREARKKSRIINCVCIIITIIIIIGAVASVAIPLFERYNLKAPN